VFDARRLALLRRRVERNARLDAGKETLRFLPETQWIRNGNWKAASIASDLRDRRVEITGPTTPAKMVINALNSGARVFLADIEDSSAPPWRNTVDGQINLRDAVQGSIEFVDARKKKRYALRRDGKRLATLMVRPRGWHLDEAHVRVDGAPMSGSLFDFGVYFYHNAHTLLKRGSAPYFYLPKMESHLEARLWNDVFVYAQARLRIPRGTVRATCLIETLLAAFEMDEIIYELREHSAGLNNGRWDYLLSFIKTFANRADKMLPDRAQLTMQAPFMAAYVSLLIQTCHRRGVHAMGGMAAQIPIKNDAKANAASLQKVHVDKLRECKAACDGTWVAHPGLIATAQNVFDKYMPTPNQINKVTDRRVITAADLQNLGDTSSHTITAHGLHMNISVGLAYVEAWLRGVGCVPLHNKMEDAATAEISRCQIWQWIRHGAVMTDGRKVTKLLVAAELNKEAQRVRTALGSDVYLNKRRYVEAVELYGKQLLSDKLAAFLTLDAYKLIVDPAARTLQSSL
jgi:malate synthase